MASEQVTEYERQRMENIKRNGEMMASLNIQSHLADLSASSTRLREEKKRKYQKRPVPNVVRCSLRAQGMPPHFVESLVPSKSNVKTREIVLNLGPVSMRDAYKGVGSHRTLVDKFTCHNCNKPPFDSVGIAKVRRIRAEECIESRPTLVDKFTCNESKKSSFGDVERIKAEECIDSHRTVIDKFTCLESSKSLFDDGVDIAKVERIKTEECIDFNSFELKPQNVARVVSEGTFVVRFLPTSSMTVVVAGNRNGKLGFWDVGHGIEGEEGIHLYQPHSGAISGISVHPFTLSKVYTCSHDGVLRSMNIEREEFDHVYSSSSGSSLHSLSQNPYYANLIYVAEGQGGLNFFDERVGQVINSWSLHKRQINTIDFNLSNPNIIATGSSDNLACIWDLRKIDMKHGCCSALHTVNLGRCVYSAYFSPSGSNLAISLIDGDINMLCGTNFEDLITIRHRHYGYRSDNSPRAVWGWDDEHIFARDYKRSIDILSVSRRKTVHKLESSYMSAISSRYDAHPCMVGMLAAATQGGYVYIWTNSL